MAKSGRKPTNLKLLKARGSRISAKREKEESTTPDYKRPRIPAWLGAEGRKEWRRILPIMERFGLLSELDTSVLGSYCAEVVMYARLEQEVTSLSTDELVCTGKGGSQYQNPIVGARNASSKRLTAFMGLLGLHPLARQGMILTPRTPPEKTGKDRFFDKKFGSEPDKIA